MSTATVITGEKEVKIIKTESGHFVNVITETKETLVLTSDALMIPVITFGSGSSSTVKVVAQEDLNQYDVVTADGLRADSNTIAHRGKILGLAIIDIGNGFSGDVQVGGEIVNALWSWNPGDKLFLNGSALSTIAPSVGFSIRIATATKPDTISVEVQPSILL